MRHVLLAGLIAVAWLMAGVVIVAALLMIQAIVPTAVGETGIEIVLVCILIVPALLPVLAHITHRSVLITSFVLLEMLVLAALAVLLAYGVALSGMGGGG